MGTATRLARLRERMAKEGIEAYWVGTAGENLGREHLRYLTGFQGSTGWLLLTQERALFLADGRYWERVRRECPDVELVKVQGRMTETFAAVVEELGIRQIAFPSETMTLAFWEQVKRGLAEAGVEVEWLPRERELYALRAVKEPEEVEALRRAVALTDEAFAHLVEVLRPGMTEREVAWAFERYVRERGYRLAFETIVAAGPGGAEPHHETGETVLEAGVPIVIDLGAVVDGYHADMTRTVVLGEPRDPEFLEAYRVVLEAQERAEAGMRAGMALAEADRLARERIEAAGYGEYFLHSLGHGVGLEIHEPPRMAPTQEGVLEAGMAVTVEPGIYLAGRWGIRIEDLVIVREDGVEVLTQTPKDPVL